jgi:parallel beta-helix repeat protein
MRSGISRWASALALAALALGSLGAGRCSGVIVVKDGESIQAAVDMAQPGDTIVVRRGTYSGPGGEALVTVMKDGITLIGSPNAVIDATGYTYGVKVGERIPGTCLVGLVQDFTIRGFTIRNAGNSGVLVANVDGYEMIGGQYYDNEEYGPYPVCSTDGYVAFNYANGHNDAAIYVGQSDGALIEFNEVENSVIGIEVENTQNTEVRSNLLKRNSAGMLIVVLPGLDVAATVGVLVEKNVIRDNNRDNTGEGFLELLPEGTGILNVGGDDVVIHDNRIQDNGSVGVASIGNPFYLLDGRIEPFVDGLEVTENVVLHNGTSPDPDRALVPGADLVYVADVLNPADGSVIDVDPDPTDNCFDANVYDTEFVLATALGPVGIPDFPCP